jgi:hypothetical protein
MHLNASELTEPIKIMRGDIMEKQATFGNVALAKKMAIQFGTKKSVTVEMRYAKEAKSFIRKVEEAHRNAASSDLVFG